MNNGRWLIMRKLLILMLAAIFLTASSFAGFFIGTEFRPMPMPPEEEPYPPEPGPMPLEVFARVEFGWFYFMLPVGTFNPDTGEFTQAPIDEKYIRDKLGIGIGIRGYITDNIYFRAASDAPIIGWMTEQEYGGMMIEVGLGLRLAIFTGEIGLMGRVYLPETPTDDPYAPAAEILLSRQFYIAAGLEF